MSTDTITTEELIERIRVLVEVNEAKDRYIKQLELQIERYRTVERFPPNPFDPNNSGFDGPMGAN